LTYNKSNNSYIVVASLTTAIQWPDGCESMFILNSQTVFRCLCLLMNLMCTQGGCAL